MHQLACNFTPQKPFFVGTPVLAEPETLLASWHQTQFSSQDTHVTVPSVRLVPFLKEKLHLAPKCIIQDW